MAKMSGVGASSFSLRPMLTEKAAAAAQPDDLLGGHLPVRGLFINYHDYGRPHFLSRPTQTSSLRSDDRRRPCRIDGKFGFIKREDPNGWYEVVDHCNGLVLFLDKRANVLHVCNPTTRWSAALPPCPAGADCHYSAFSWGTRRAFLVFDPFMSPEYKVVLSPEEPGKKQMVKDDVCHLMEWPPSTWTTWYTFSSSTGRWEEKVFIRQGEAVGTVGELLLLEEWGCHHVEHQCRYAAYWQGALYIHCRGEFVSRFSLLDNKYRVIKSPIELAECKNGDVRTFPGRSEKGVYIAAIAVDGLAKLRVWNLSESGGQIVWVPKDESNLKINTYSWWPENNKFDERKYWTLDLEAKYWMFNHDNQRKNQVCWNSDDDNIVNISEDKHDVLPYIKFLGFHPYKEIIFLCCDGNAVASHLNSPKVQYLGSVHLAGEYHRGIRESFVYTPSLIGD